MQRSSTPFTAKIDMLRTFRQQQLKQEIQLNRFQSTHIPPAPSFDYEQSQNERVFRGSS